MKTLSIDIETYSDQNLAKTGVYRYVESPVFEILLFSYSVDGNPVQLVDLACGEEIPAEVISALTDDSVTKWAFNANFERICLSRYLGYPTGEYLDSDSWKCSMVWAATMGLPLSLEGVGAVLGLEKQKLTEGKEFGLINPVIIDRDFGVIAGHGRILAAREEGITEVPCVFADHLTEAQKKAYIIADNRMAMDAGWGEELLRVEIEALQAADFDPLLTGFDEKELSKLFDNGIDAKEDDFDVDAELQKPTFSKSGDVWTLGRHRLVCGDSTKEETYALLMDGRKANLVITDPPYNVNYEGSAGKIKNDNMDGDKFYQFLFDAFLGQTFDEGIIDIIKIGELKIFLGVVLGAGLQFVGLHQNISDLEHCLYNNIVIVGLAGAAVDFIDNFGQALFLILGQTKMLCGRQFHYRFCYKGRFLMLLSMQKSTVCCDIACNLQHLLFSANSV